MSDQVAQLAKDDVENRKNNDEHSMCSSVSDNVHRMHVLKTLLREKFIYGKIVTYETIFRHKERTKVIYWACMWSCVWLHKKYQSRHEKT